MEKKFFLKPNVKVEPLFNNWYVWPHLISPATAAMHISNWHLKILRSYVQSPEVHAAAVKNPAMRGGPFLDFDSKRIDEIRALLKQTETEQAALLKLAEAIKNLNDILNNEARGYGLETLYAKVPEQLKGYVELYYDLNNRPNFRFIESLLYRSPYYNRTAQAITLSLVDKDDRPFVFSTPRLQDDEHLFLNIAFEDSVIDELFKMRYTPQSFSYIKNLLDTDSKYDDLLLSLLTEEKPISNYSSPGDRLRVRYFGHASILIEACGVSILTDPLISYEYKNDFQRYTIADLPEVIDYVLLTHSHSDHVVFETLLQLRHKIKTIIVPRNNGGSLEDPSLKLLLNNTGFRSVVEIDELESINIPGGAITGLPFFGEHGDLNIRSKMAYSVQLDSKSMLCVADSANLEPRLYDHLKEVIGPVDMLFVGMECDGAPLTWMYGPLITKPLDRKMDQSRRLSGSDFEKALNIVNKFDCRQVYIYAMGQEPWLSFITSIKYTEESKPIVESNKLVEACKQKGIVAERLLGIKEIYL